jgi:hypothetical protein
MLYSHKGYPRFQVPDLQRIGKSPDSRFRPNRESGVPSPIPGQIGNRGNRNWGFPGPSLGRSRGGAAPLQVAGYWEALSPGPLTVPRPRPKGTVTVAAHWPRAVTVPVALGCVVRLGRVHN